MKKEDITCPTCGKEKTWNANNPSRPFCCERCKLIDLGAWADEEHRIESEEPFSPHDDSDENEIL